MSIKNTWSILSDSTRAVILEISGGNEDAKRVCVQITESVLFVDPECGARPLGHLAPLYCLDDLGIRDSNIYLFYKDVCREHVGYMMALLRGVFLGLIPEKTLQYAVTHHGEGVDIDAVVQKVRELLPSFDPEKVVCSA